MAGNVAPERPAAGPPPSAEGQYQAGAGQYARPAGRSRPGAGLRVSDAERDAVAAELAEHLQAGRLQVDEFDERVSRAIAARTRGDLDELLSDLPRPAASQPPPPSPRRSGLPFPLVAILIFATGTFLIGGISRGAAAGGHPVWAIWWLWWLIPLAIFTARRRLHGDARDGR
jgi:Domain of unknown function (DUF1707)